jgi:hypothetical protein
MCEFLCNGMALPVGGQLFKAPLGSKKERLRYFVLLGCFLPGLLRSVGYAATICAWVQVSISWGFRTHIRGDLGVSQGVGRLIPLDFNGYSLFCLCMLGCVRLFF